LANVDYLLPAIDEVTACSAPSTPSCQCSTICQTQPWSLVVDLHQQMANGNKGLKLSGGPGQSVPRVKMYRAPSDACWALDRPAFDDESPEGDRVLRTVSHCNPVPFRRSLDTDTTALLTWIWEEPSTTASLHIIPADSCSRIGRTMMWHQVWLESKTRRHVTPAPDRYLSSWPYDDLFSIPAVSVEGVLIKLPGLVRPRSCEPSGTVLPSL